MNRFHNQQVQFVIFPRRKGLMYVHDIINLTNKFKYDVHTGAASTQNQVAQQDRFQAKEHHQITMMHLSLQRIGDDVNVKFTIRSSCASQTFSVRRERERQHVTLLEPNILV